MSNNETIDLSDSSTDSIILLDESVAEETDKDDDLFYTDTSQCEEHDNSAFSLNDESLTENSGVVSHLATPDSKVNDKRRKNLCFNCMGEHPLAVCTEPRDNRRISKNRESFLGLRYGKSSRLHEQQNNEFKPGFISDNLREALGIGADCLPEWIFRMRKRGFVQGYPPAYLKRAIEKNVLSFVTDGDDVEDNDVALDRSKMFAYPGFNKFARGFKDPERFKVPSWDEFIRLHEEALAHKCRSQGTKRKHEQRKSRAQAAKRKRDTIVDRSLEDGEIVDDESILDRTSNSLQSELDSSKVDTTKRDEVETVTKGTPILMSRSISEEDFNHDVQKPDLENFSKDIVPFEHRNITQESGFFSKMLNIVKGLKRKKT